MTVSKAQLQAVYKYKAKTYKRIPLDYPISELATLMAAAAAANQPINTYIKQAIRQRIESGK